MAGNANTVFWNGEPPRGSSDWRSAGNAATTAPAVEAGTIPVPPMMEGFHYPTSSDESTATAVTVAGQPPESLEVMEDTTSARMEVPEEEVKAVQPISHSGR